MFLFFSSQSLFQIDPNSKEYLLAKYGFDTAENEPCKVYPLSVYRSPRYDLFLSHKQSDAKDFVRALHTMLTEHGYKCFLDVEFDGELGSLAEIVSQSEQVLFVLTDKVAESGRQADTLKAVS